MFDLPLAIGIEEVSVQDTDVADDGADVDTIVVTGTRQAPRVDRRSYDIDVGADAASVTSREALERLPGVIVDVEGELSVIGQPIGSVLVDGRFFPRELALQIPAAQIDRIEIITNPGAEAQTDGVTINIVLKSATEGSRTLNVSTRADTRDRYRLLATYNEDGPRWSQIATLTVEDEERLLDRSANLAFLTEGQLGETADRTEARSGHERFVKVVGVTGRKFSNGRKISLIGSASLTDRGTQNDRRFVRRGADDVLLDRIEDSETDRRPTSFVLGLGYNRDRGKNDKASISVNGSFFNRTSRHRDAITLDDDVPQLFRRDLHTTSDAAFLNASRERKRDNGDRWELGLFGQVSQQRQRFSGIDAFAPNNLLPRGYYTADRNELAVFGSYSFWLGGLEVKPGLRVESFSLDLSADGQTISERPSYARLLPSLHVGYGVGDWGTLKASAVQRAVTPIENTFDPIRRKVTFDTFEEGDPSLDVGRALNLEISHEIKRGDVTLLTTGYHRHRTDTVEPFIDFLGQDLFLTRYVNVDQDTETGVNLNVTHKIGSRLEQSLDVNVFGTRQKWDVEGCTFERELDTYDAKYNLEYKHDDKRSALLILQQEGPGLDLNAQTDSRLSSTIRYVQRFDSGYVLTLEGIDLLATNERTSVFESDTLDRTTLTRFQERGFRATLVRQF